MRRLALAARSITGPSGAHVGPSHASGESMFWITALLATTVVSAAEIRIEVGQSIQDAINDASPGDTITLAAGTYEEDLSTETDGTADAPITVMAEEDAEVIVTASGEVLQIDHEYWVFDHIIFDGKYGNTKTIEINDGAHHTRLQNIEVRRSARHCIEMAAPEGVHISDSLIHHCLYFDPDDEVRRDAHGITGGAVRDMTIENTDIHTFSGSAIQFDPGRASPGWDNIHIDGCRFWLEPLIEHTAGFLPGQVPGENAIDTKTWNDADTANLTIVDTEAWGFKNGLDTPNQAAFLFRENVAITLERVKVHDSEIAFRLRGPTSARPKGATVHMENILVHDVRVGIQYENELDYLAMWHVTFGANIETLFDEVDSESTEPDILNSLFLGESLPEEVDVDDHNMAATIEDFVDAASGNHHLVESSSAIDAASVISGVSLDIDGLARIVGPAPDLGAHEYGGAVVTDTGAPTDTGENDDGENGSTETNDSGISTDDDGHVGGIGAAEQVGEKGGCGCSATHYGKQHLFWILLAALFSSRRRLKSEPGQFTA
jgi:hypothetical protein